MKKILALSLGIVLMASSIWGATLISLPNTYTTGTKIQTSQANANEQHIQTVVNGNMPTGDVVGTTDSQTLTNKSLTSPILTTAPSITGDATWSTGIKAIFGNASRYIIDDNTNGFIEFSTHTTIPAASKLYLDGGANTYITESSADRISFVAGGTERLTIDGATGIYIPATLKLYLDGGGNTYIYESAVDVLDVFVGGGLRLSLTPTAFISATVYNQTTADGANINVGADGAIKRSTSARKYKSNERTLPFDKTKLMGLKAVLYNSKCTNDNKTKDFIGIVADDAVKYYPELVTYGKDGQVEGFQYERLTVVLLNAIQAQQTQIDAQNQEIKNIKERLAKLEGK